MTTYQIERENETSVPRIPAGLDLDLMLIGTSDQEKKMIGNLILGKEVTLSKQDDDDESTKDCQLHYVEIDGRNIKLMSLPSMVGTTPESEDQGKSVFEETVRNGLELFPNGLNALLVVMPYSLDFATKHLKFVKTLKWIFGKDVIRNNSVLILTHDVTLKPEVKNEGGSGKMLKECMRQEDEAIDLLQECRFRCVIFHNNIERKSQLLELVSKVDSLRDRESHYSLDNFLAAMRHLQHKTLVDKIMRDMNFSLMQINQNGPESKQLSDFKAKIDMMKNSIDKHEGPEISDLKQYLYRLRLYVMSCEQTLYDADIKRKDAALLQRAQASLETETHKMKELMEQLTADSNEFLSIAMNETINRLEEEKIEMDEKVKKLEKQYAVSTSQSKAVFEMMHKVVKNVNSVEEENVVREENALTSENKPSSLSVREVLKSVSYGVLDTVNNILTH